MKDNRFRQTIPVTVRPGYRVTLFEGVDMDEEGGFASSVMFEDEVRTFNETTKKLEFKDSDIGYSEFVSKLRKSDGVQIIA